MPKKIKINKWDIVEIEWLDSVVTNRPIWCLNSLVNWNMIENSSLHKTVGYLIRETDVFISVCQSRRETDDQIGMLMTIPKKAIIKVRKLK
ncbi:MAG: hypothetical protein ACTSR2_00510 [Candidatus Hodarchaeales archaeon]